MITLTFNNTIVNESLRIGDLAYYVSNPNTSYEGSGIITGDDNVSGISTQIFMGVIVNIEKTWEHVEDVANYSDGYQYAPQGQSGYTLYISVQQTNSLPAAPQQGDYIFFAKNTVVEKASVRGYYNKVKFQNNSKGKAELFAVSCGVAESSK